MIEFLTGHVESITSRGLIIQVAGIGLFVQVINPLTFAAKEEVRLQIFWHWNAEKGPALFGFVAEQEKSAFATLLECPKIGPQIALQLLAQAGVTKLFNLLALGDEQGLSALSGIGPKKAKTLVMELQQKAGALLAQCKPDQADGHTLSGIMLEEAIGALKSMGYQPTEINSAILSIDKKTLQSTDFTGLTRMLLAQLLRQKNNINASRG